MAAAARRARHRVRRPPARLRTWPLVLRGPAGPALVSLARQPGDLLVIGAGRRTALTRLVCCPVARHCLAHAHCPVLAIPPPALARELAHRRLAWLFWHRPLTPERVLRDQSKPVG